MVPLLPGCLGFEGLSWRDDLQLRDVLQKHIIHALSPLSQTGVWRRQVGIFSSAQREKKKQPQKWPSLCPSSQLPACLLIEEITGRW